MKTLRLLGILALFLALSCAESSSKKFESNPEIFKEYIAAFTTGPLPARSDIRVQLTQEMPNWKPNTELASNLFSISPRVAGKVVSLGNSTVAFVPEKPLENGTNYQVRFNLAKAVSTPEGLDEFRFSVRTIKQDAQLKILDFQSYDASYSYVNGQLRTADAITLEQAKAIVSAQIAGKDLKLKWDTKASSPTDFRFVIDSLVRETAQTELELLGDMKSLDISRKETLKFPVAAKGDFKVLRMESGTNGSSEVTINFSERLDKNQDFTGLVAIENAPNLRFATQGNVLKVFFDAEHEKKKSVVELTAIDGDSTDSGLSVPIDEEPTLRENARKTRRVEIFPGIKTGTGKKLDKKFVKDLEFGQINPEIRLLKSGVILPSSSNLKVNFEAVNLHSVDVTVYRIYKNNVMQFLQENTLNGRSELRRVAQPIAKKTLQLKQNQLLDYTQWNAYAVDLAQLITPDPGSLYRVEFSAKRSYSLYSCSSDTNDEGEYGQDESTEDWDEDVVNYSYYYDDYYDEFWYEGENPCDYYYFQKRIGTNVLASDLGVIVKRGLNKSYTIAVSDLITTKPVSGAKVELYNFQQQLISSGATGSEGMVQFQADKLAYFAIVSKNNQMSYVKLSDQQSLSLSNFDVSGVVLEKGLKGYLYGERGVWRPGDSIYLSFILNDRANPLPEKHPVKFRLNDPMGKTVYETVKPTHNSHHYVFKMATRDDAPTGNYEARVSVGGANFYKSVKVETIKPNRLKIQNSAQDVFISTLRKEPFQLQVNWLHGAVAKNMKTEVQMKLTQSATSFKGFENYDFEDDTRHFYDDEVSLFTRNTSALGQITYNIQPNLQWRPPGKLKAAIISKVHENGGDVSTDVVTADYSPYVSYVGMSAPKSDRGYLDTDKSYSVSLVSLKENGSLNPKGKLLVYVYRLQARWWWESSSDDLSYYSKAQYVSAYQSHELHVGPSGKASFSIKIPKEDWGRYLVRVVDSESQHASSTVMAFDHGDWGARNGESVGKEATVLSFNLDKSQYKAGEKARLTFPSSANGRALISIENGTEVLQSFWVTTTEGHTSTEWTVTSDMVPNVYVHVSLLQPHANTINDAPIRLYGVQPIYVEDPQTRLQPVVQLPKELKPNQNFEVKVSESKGKAMSYTLAIVDEGLLDLTRFKTPNAWDSFFERTALGVRTWDIYNEVIGAYGGKINQVFALGGDAALGGGKAKKANRFPPVVKFIGPFELGSGGTNRHQISLPNYVGSVRVMVVGANLKNNAYGSAEKTVAVKSPLMALASLPRKITPGEKVELPVTLFAMNPNIKTVDVQVKTSSNLKLVGSAVQKIKFDKPDEKMAYFQLEVAQITGIGKVEVTAKSGNYSSKYSVELDLVNPNPTTHTFKDLVLKSKGSGNLPIQSFGSSGSTQTRLELSAFPQIDMNRRLDYLIQYPHGCVEQTTSGVFAQLYLMDVMELANDRQASIQRNIQTGIKRIASLQLANGGLGYWPGASEADYWATSYAGHFMLEAEQKGYSLPSGFKSKWIKFQKKESARWRYEARYANDIDQAYRLYTLALINQPDLASMNRLRETKGITNEAKFRLAATYALLQQKDAARQLIASAQLGNYDKRYAYYGSVERNRAMELEALLLLGDDKNAFQTAKILAKSLSSSQWMSTQSTAFSLMVMSKFAMKNGKDGIEVEVVMGGKKTVIRSKRAVVTLTLPKGAKGEVQLKNLLGNSLYARLLSSGILPIGQELALEQNLGVEQLFRTRDGQELDISNLKQGTELVAEIILTNLSSEELKNVALTQIVPSGLEIVNTRFTEYGSYGNNEVDYTDIRDDRANYYMRLKPKETKTFTLLLNASYAGQYYMPGVQAEAMYDNQYQARTKGFWMKVKR